jgi:hypothetical protein
MVVRVHAQFDVSLGVMDGHFRVVVMMMLWRFRHENLLWKPRLRPLRNPHATETRNTPDHAELLRYLLPHFAACALSS